MTAQQVVGACAEHTACVVIALDGGGVAWESHWRDDVHPEHRINPDLPAVDGGARPVTWSPPCSTCAPLMP